jgi:GT2 family glycosyltransferase
VDRWPWLRPVLGRAGDRYWCADLPRERDGVVGQPAAACLLLRREAVGPQLFDPRFRLFFNDTELALRLNRRGYCRYLGSMSVVHFGGVSIRRAADRPAMRREYDRSYFRYCRSFVRGWPLLAPIFWSRALADAVLKVLRACFD